MTSKLTNKVKHWLSEYWPLLLIISSLLIIILSNIRNYEFWDWDECIYTQYAKTMRQTGNFLTNQWNGIPVFDKPTLTGIAINLFSWMEINEVSSRMAMIFLSLVLIASTYLFAKKYFSTKVAILATFLLLVAELYVLYSIRVNTDIGVALFTFLGLFFWLSSYSKPSFSYLAGVSFGLAVLSKGLSVGPYLTSIFLSIFLFPKKKYFANYFKMLLIFFISILPWHLYEYLTYGQKFIDFYIIDNIIKRARYPLEFHFEGRLFYFKLIYNNFFPWIIFAAALPLYYLSKIKKYLNAKKLLKELEKERIVFTLILIIVVPLFMITSIKTRIAWYILPLYPFIAIYLAYNIDFVLARLPFKKVLYSILIIIFVVESYSLIMREVSSKNSDSVRKRNLTLIKSRESPISTLDYLVQFSERRAKETLAPHLQTANTFIYGGNPCAVFYSEKRVNYYYSTDDFLNRLKQNRGLYMLENGDYHFVDGLPIKIIYRNSDYTLFEN